MSVISLVNQAVAWYAASAVLAFLFALRKPLSGAIAGIGGAVASAMLVLAGGTALLMPERVSGGMLQMLHLTLRVGGVNALWLLAIGLSALPISLFNIAWHRHPQVKANGLLVNLLLAAAVCAVVVTNFGALVVMAEIMALCAAFLTGCAQSGKLWFALGRLGTLLMAWSCWLVWSSYGTLELAQITQLAMAAPQNALLWLPGLVGFALLAGVIPLHGWAPQAHAGASAPAAALFSTVVMKVGLYGILTVSLAGSVPPAVVGRDAAGAGHDHRLRRRAVRPDGAQYSAPAGVPHPGKHRHYPARPSGRSSTGVGDP
ncbi:formate hydrogenlyase subunit 3 [Klebsiella michiganensis]|uniref:Formate hydrogenlyase subunit 3 n=1 Tax=Klebsiella michiganensis TaxID=1134687 RepID=A0A7H4PMK2_9ENTR|nr:formate hydrogenlyase subunit 3 [Klebsiella michiganensis]